MGVTLAAWTANRRAARQHWRSIIAALAYPAVAVVLSIAVFLMLGILVVPTFRVMFHEFGLKLPVPTIYVLRATESALDAASDLGELHDERVRHHGWRMSDHTLRDPAR